jgi:hypothetical protein
MLARMNRTWRLTSAAWALVIVTGYRLFTLIVTLSYRGTVTSLHKINTATSVFSWWDGLWYLRIAEHGYDPHFRQSSKLGMQLEAAFPPALAGLMAGAHHLFGLDYTVAGLLWGFAALVAIGVGLVRLVEIDYRRHVALLTLAFLLLWPPAIFLGMVYQDGLTLAGVIWAFVFVRRGRPALAGICLGFACLGKLVALAAIVALAVELLHNTSGPHRFRDLPALAAGPVVAITGWLLYSGIRFHNLTVALDAERAWGHELTTPWHSIHVTATAIGHTPSQGYRLVLYGDFVAIGLMLLAAIYLALRRARPSYVVYSATMLLVLTTNGNTSSVGRYTLQAFTLFLAAALAVDSIYRQRRQAGFVVAGAVVAAAIPVQLWLIGRFARYYWSG